MIDLLWVTPGKIFAAAWLHKYTGNRRHGDRFQAGKHLQGCPFIPETENEISSEADLEDVLLRT